MNTLGKDERYWKLRMAISTLLDSPFWVKMTPSEKMELVKYVVQNYLMEDQNGQEV